ncbi:MAG: hypothetical protein MUC41_03880 [Syntrophobacteraceae bacterium]|nr:hypothetical protein [Syntrophobacteraceae bacterium]
MEEKRFHRGCAMKRRSLTASGLAGLCLAALLGSASFTDGCGPPESREIDHTLGAVKDDVPFNVGLHSSTPEKPSLSLRRNRSGLMVLKNDDPHTYAVSWWLAIPNESTILGGKALLPPKSAQPVVVEPPPAWFGDWFEGLFKDAERSALLNLTVSPGAAPGDGPVGPAKTLSVQLRLSFWPDGTRGFWSNAILFGLLLLGGICSLVLGMWIPNKLACIELIRRLDELAQKTRSISRKTDSALRVGVRVERLRLWELLRDLGMLNADGGEQLKRFEKDIDLLSTRIELVAFLDEVAQRLETLRRKTSDAPPHLLDRAAGFLEEATRILKLVHPTESGFQEARTAIQSADTILDRLGEADPELARALAAQIKLLRTEYHGEKGVIGSRETCRRLRAKLTDLFAVLKDETYENPAEITPSRTHWINISIEKLFVLRHYILRFDDTRADEARHERVKACEERLIKLLRLQSPYTLELARDLREEIEQDVLASDVIEELRAGRVSTKTEPLSAHANAPVRLWVEFGDPRFNHCAALKGFRCVWVFRGTVGQEQGWEITHYFRNEKEATYDIELRTGDGRAVASKPDEQVRFHPRLRERWWARLIDPGKWLGDRGKVETGRLMLALLIAVLALVGGAREQLMKLDVFPGLVAVFLLGFGADTVKNLFTRRG